MLLIHLVFFLKKRIMDLVRIAMIKLNPLKFFTCFWILIQEFLRRSSNLILQGNLESNSLLKLCIIQFPYLLWFNGKIWCKPKPMPHLPPWYSISTISLFCELFSIPNSPSHSLVQLPQFVFNTFIFLLLLISIFPSISFKEKSITPWVRYPYLLLSIYGKIINKFSSRRLGKYP